MVSGGWPFNHTWWIAELCGIIIIAICANHPSLTHIKKGAHTRNGCAEYWALYDHYLGDSNADHLADQADCKLIMATYYGKEKRWNFEKYVALYIQQHTILNGLKQFQNTGIDKCSMIQYFMNSINLPSMQAVSLTIQKCPSRECSFEWVASM
jgi:hypothetical protein